MVTDANAGGTDFETIAVVNQAPVAGVSGPTTGAFGTPLTFTLTATDVAPDEAARFAYNIDWNNDGTPDETIPPTPGNGAGVSVTHTSRRRGKTRAR